MHSTRIKNTAVQALGQFDATAIAGSERIEEDFSALKGRLDMGKPLTFHVNLDVRRPHSWKTPYKDIKVPADAGPPLLCALPFQTGVQDACLMSAEPAGS